MNGGNPIIIPLRVTCEHDDIGLAFPFGKKKPAETPLTPEEQKTTELVRSELPTTDHIAELDVPLRNLEKIINTFFKYIISDVMTYFDQVRELFIGWSGLLGKRFHDSTRADLDRRRKRALDEATARQAAGTGSWVTETLTMITRSDQSNLFRFLKSTKKADDNVTEMPPLDGATETVAPLDTTELEPIKKALLDADPVDSTAKLDAKLETLDSEKDAETIALIKSIKEQQDGITKQLRDEKEEKERLEKEAFDNSEEEVAKRKHEEASKYSAIQLKQPKYTEGIINWSKKITSSTLTKTINLMPDSGKLVGWMEKIPLTDIFDPTKLRAKIDEHVMHRIGFHKGSTIYSAANLGLDKIWFILNPLIGYANYLVSIVLKTFDFLNFKMALPVMSTYGASANKVFQVFWGFHGLLVDVVVSLALWFVVFTWWWCRVGLVRFYRFILNLVLSRFGISI